MQIEIDIGKEILLIKKFCHGSINSEEIFIPYNGVVDPHHFLMRIRIQLFYFNADLDLAPN